MKIKEIQRIADTIFIVIIFSAISFYTGYYSNSKECGQCYFSGNCQTEDECELYTKLDKIIIDRMSKKK